MQNEFHRMYSGQPEQDDAPIGVVELWRILWRNRLRIVLPAAGLGMLATVYMLSSEDVYTAEAQLLLTRSNLDIIELAGADELGFNAGAIANALAMLSSRTVALRVIELLDLTEKPHTFSDLSAADSGPQTDASSRQPFLDWLPNITGSAGDRLSSASPEEIERPAHNTTVLRQLALGWLTEVTHITSVPDTNVIIVRASTLDPQLSAEVANAYVNVYLDYQRQLARRRTERAAEALEARVSELSSQLEKDQESLQSFRARVQGADPESAQAFALEASNLHSRIDATDSSLADLEKAIVLLSPTIIEDFDSLRALFSTTDILNRLEQSTLGRTIAQRSYESDRVRLLAALKAESKRLGRLRDALRRGLDAIETRINEANAASVVLRQLTVELETTSQIYESSLARLKNLPLQGRLRDAGAQSLATAEAPLEASADRLGRNVTITAFLGLFLGIAHVLLREAANERIRSVSELTRASGIDQVIGIPPEKRNWGPATHFKKSSSTPYHEGIRTLRHRLLLSTRQSQGSSAVGIFSALPGESNSSVAKTLAQSLGAIDRHVILVDGNMRTGNLSNYCAISLGSPGLSNLISGKVDLSQSILNFPNDGFDFLPCGKSDTNPGDLLELDKFRQLLAALRKTYEFVLIDAPPVLVAPDACNIAVHVDEHVFFALNGYSHRPAVRDALAALHSSGGRQPIVALLNAREAFGSEYGAVRKGYT